MIVWQYPWLNDNMIAGVVFFQGYCNTGYDQSQVLHIIDIIYIYKIKLAIISLDSILNPYNRKFFQLRPFNSMLFFHIRKLQIWKTDMVLKGLRLNTGKTKVMRVSSEQGSGRRFKNILVVFAERVLVPILLCVCSGISGRLMNNVDFNCTMFGWWFCSGSVVERDWDWTWGEGGLCTKILLSDWHPWFWWWCAGC